MLTTLLTLTAAAAGDGAPVAAPAKVTPAVSFHAPTLVTAGGSPVRVEAPGYASPSLADVDGDGDKDLLVGQFAGGKIHLFENQGDGNYAEGQWLQAGGKVAEVPGVW